MSTDNKSNEGKNTAEETLSGAAVPKVEFPTQLVDELLSDLESQPFKTEVVMPSEAEHAQAEPAPSEPLADDAAASKPLEVAGDVLEADAAPAEADTSPEEGVTHSAEVAQEKVAEAHALESEEDALPPLTEIAHSIDPHDMAEEPVDDMPILERVQYHARMRRREQTRLRRENARKGVTEGEPEYQTSMLDMRVTLLRLGVTALFLVIGLLLRQQKTASFALFILAYIAVGFPTVIAVARGFTRGKYFNENLLILIASLGAFLLKRYPEASFVLMLHELGKLISDLVLGNARKSLSKLTDFVPDYAAVVNMQGEERRVQPGDVQIGDFIMVRSGERVPIDGVVLRGEGTVDDTVLTGDSEPVEVTKGATVFAGSLYEGTLMLIRATSSFADCGISQMSRIREESIDRRATVEQSAVQGVVRYMPVIIVLAILLAALPPLFNFGAPATWIYRALTVLVVCCPTAIMLSVPLSFMGGSGRMSQKGIQVKGSAAIEKLAELRMVVFDKTGTLTEGNLRVKEVHTTQDFNAKSLIALAATAEQFSQHPVARAVVAAYPSVPPKISEFEEFPGRGVRARVGNRNLFVGNRKLMIARGVKGVPEIRGTVLYVAYEGDYAGAIELEDTVRPEAELMISDLKTLGVLRTVILTGDTELPAQQVADAIGIDTVHSGLLPEEKASKMEFLLRTIPTDGTAAYVGDGINDLAELKLADVGVAMGVAGSRKSADVADVLIMSHHLGRFVEAVRISRQTHSVAMQNMLLVLGVKAILTLLTVFGITTMWQAVSFDVLMTVLTVLNAARLLKTK